MESETHSTSSARYVRIPFGTRLRYPAECPFTGWKNPRYDSLIRDANLQTDNQKRAEIFREAELMLVAEEAPIVPIYFYAGFNYFDPTKIEGVWQNILDEHPMQYIRRKKVFSVQSSVSSPDLRAKLSNGRTLNTEY